jgi:CBS domain containing-hemolysin-like protein
MYDVGFGVIVLRLLAALALIATNGFFVAVEFAVVAVRPAKIDRLVAQGRAVAKVARSMLSNPDRVIAACQLGITMASLALGWVGEATIAAIVEPPLHALIGRWSEAAAATAGTVVAFGLITFAHIVVGEQVPKAIGVRHATNTALAVARPMAAFGRIFRPFVALLDGATAAVLRLLRTEPIAGHRVVYTVDELRLLVRESQEGGALEAEQEEMLQKVLAFGDRRVEEVMIPRPEIVGVEKGQTVRDLLQLFLAASHARFPVYQGDLDNVVGIVSVKDVLHSLAQDPAHMETDVARLARPAFCVPETRRVGDLLGDMQARRDQMAVVIDEFGGTAGVVTLEELVEEIVGQVSDELAAESEPVVWLDEHTAEVDAQLRVDEINAELDLALPEGDEYETLAGLILYRLQHVPVEGETLKVRGFLLTVTRMKGPKIERAQVAW